MEKITNRKDSPIFSRYEYSKGERALIIALIYGSDHNEKQPFKISSERLLSVTCGDSGYDDPIKAITQLGDMIMEKPLKITSENGIIVCNWISSIEYDSNKDRIECWIDPKMLPYYYQLKTEYTPELLNDILKLKSSYSLRLFDLCQAWSRRGSFEVGVEDFKEVMCVPEGTYKSYPDLKRRVIQNAVDEINEKTDLLITFSENRSGRKKVSSFNFFISRKKIGGFEGRE